jgi:hypothetical protein
VQSAECLSDSHFTGNFSILVVDVPKHYLILSTVFSKQDRIPGLLLRCASVGVRELLDLMLLELHVLQTQSQLLTSRGPAYRSGPAVTGDVPEGPKYGESSHSGNEYLERMAIPPKLARSGQPGSPLNEPSPLGLTLRKTPSLLDLIQMKLENNGDQGGPSSPDSVVTQEAERNRPEKFVVPAGNAQVKLKASNFPATRLKIGTWEVEAFFLSE